MLERIYALLSHLHPSPQSPASAELQALRAVWESQARSDPLWAVLSEPDKRGRAWKLDEFLATGETAVGRWIERVERAGGAIRFGCALDFGCGVGRLSQALAARFKRVRGVDISPTMIAFARRINRRGSKLRYVLNEREDLSIVPSRSIDFVLSHITLQHIPPSIAVRYLEEFFRIARPGGILVFQVPSRLRHQPLTAVQNDLPMLAASCRAELSLAGAMPELRSGRPTQLPVRVRNASPVEWVQSTSFPINLGNHWLDATGTKLVHDDGRERLPLRLGPGEEVILKLLVIPPQRVGPLTLELDLVQEGVRWFKEAGSPTLRLPIEFAAAAPVPMWRRLNPRPVAFEDLLEPVYTPPPSFAMHGIPKEEVLAHIRQHGGRLLAIDKHLTEWESYGYYVQTAED
jgi:SAM-dependent methyltransferase